MNPEIRVPVAIYDDRCGVCRRIAAMIRQAISPHKLDVIPCGSTIQKKLAPHVDQETCRKYFVFVDAHNNILEGSAAAEALASLAPSLRYHPWFIRRLGSKSAARALYRIAHWIRKMTRRAS